MLIFGQKSSWFCIPSLESWQPKLPYAPFTTSYFVNINCLLLLESEGLLTIQSQKHFVLHKNALQFDLIYVIISKSGYILWNILFQIMHVLLFYVENCLPRFGIFLKNNLHWVNLKSEAKIVITLELFVSLRLF